MSDIRTSVLQYSVLSKGVQCHYITVNDLLISRREKTFPDNETLIPRLTDSVALIMIVFRDKNLC